MVLNRLSIQNFLSIKSIDLELSNQGLVLIKGKNLDNDAIDNNGSGKSSIVESLVYALYGRTIRGLKGDDVVNNVTKKNTKIFLDLVDDQGDEYRIARYRKHHVNKNRSMLYRNGVDITPRSENALNEYIVDLLQMDYVTFTSSILYTAESFKFTSATDAEMKSTFDKMLGLDVFSNCLEIAKSRLKDVETSISTDECKIADREDRIEKLNEQISEAEVMSKEYKSSQEEKIKLLNEKMDKYLNDIADLNTESSNLNESLKECTLELKQASDTLDAKKKMMKEVEELKFALQDIKNEISSKNSTLNRCLSDISSLDSNTKSLALKIEACNHKIDGFKTDKKALDNSIGQPCPTCGHPMSEKSIEPARKEYDEKIGEQEEHKSEYEHMVKTNLKHKKELESLVSETESSINDLSEDKEKFEKLLSKSSNIINEKEEAEDLFHELSLKQSKMEGKIQVVKDSIKKSLDYVEQTELLIKDESSKNNPYVVMIDKYKLEQDTCNSEIKEITDKISTKLDEKQCLQFWVQAYSNQGIKSLILDDITPFLNRRVNKYLTRLASGHIEVKFNAQTVLKSGESREKFSIEINNIDGGSEYIANSAGEKKRVDLAINLALQDLVASRSNKSLNIAVFDEVFDGLDQSGIESVIELLQDIVKDKSSVFVISHNPHLQFMFSNVITVVKKNGYSTLSDDSNSD